MIAVKKSSKSFNDWDEACCLPERGAVREARFRGVWKTGASRGQEAPNG